MLFRPRLWKIVVGSETSTRSRENQSDSDERCCALGPGQSRCSGEPTEASAKSTVSVHLKLCKWHVCSASDLLQTRDLACPGYPLQA